MAIIVHGFDWPDRVVVGAVGDPGSRTFYLQARSGNRIVSISLEKEQSALLAEKIEEILDQLMRLDGNPVSVPAVTPIELVDNDPLEQPVDADANDPSEMERIEVEPTEMMMVRIPVGTARTFAQRTLEVVGAGRPICSDCGTPIDPEGYVYALPDEI